MFVGDRSKDWEENRVYCSGAGLSNEAATGRCLLRLNNYYLYTMMYMFLKRFGLARMRHPQWYPEVGITGKV